ncbi:MAG: polyphosphate polymerase domain-containing protein [Candidatus Gracilibacteria bacterium]|nr:polyphosphate polymerase domain-containing protein [Candidatus Gracilibacteria bacterium]
MIFDTEGKLQQFSSLSLNELNNQASYLKRIDRKFLLSVSQLDSILKELQEDYSILEIGEKQVFSYDNMYMDTQDYLFYHQHQNKEKSRTKIRTRLYKDSDIAFFEFKQKLDGVTQKFRYQFPSEEHGTMTKGKKRFFEGVWQSIYNGNPEAPYIFPSMRTSYNRITLVEKTGGERLTIDFNIQTCDVRAEKTQDIPLKNLVIIESKSLGENCKSEALMKKYNISQANSCSKYSLGIVYAGLVKKYDTFQNTLNEIEKITVESMVQKD